MDERLYTDVERPSPAGRPWLLPTWSPPSTAPSLAGGRVRALTGPADQRLLEVLRSLVDVMLVGAKTVRAERYGPAKLDAGLRAARAGRGQPPVPPIAVVSASV